MSPSDPVAPPAPPAVSAPAVALVSGGLDSCLMVWRALVAGTVIHPLFVHQGALWQDRELEATERFLAVLAASDASGRLQPLVVLRAPLPPDYPRRWAVDPAVPPPDADTPDEAVDLPGKNLVLLTHGALLALGRGIHRVHLGALDSNPFADARDEFFRAFEALFERSTGHAVRVERPLRGWSKERLLQDGRALPLEATFSCLRPVRGLHCGRCNKCAERRRAFARAGVNDPTPYAQALASTPC